MAPGPVATAIGATAIGATAIGAPWRSTLAGQLLGPITAATIPTSAELAAAITGVASGDASNVNAVILACDGGRPAL